MVFFKGYVWLHDKYRGKTDDVVLNHLSVLPPGASETALEISIALSNNMTQKKVEKSLRRLRSNKDVENVGDKWHKIVRYKPN